MSKEGMELALNKAFQLGQRYWSWSDSEYSSHWEKADAAKAKFDQLVQDTINAALAEQPAQQEIDWKDQYEKQKRRADMWVAKYEADIGPLEKAGPVTAQQEPDDLMAAYMSGVYDGRKQRTWVGLTEAEIHNADPLPHNMFDRERIDFARAIEAKLEANGVRAKSLDAKFELEGNT